MALAIYLTHLKENCKNIPLNKSYDKTGLAKRNEHTLLFFFHFALSDWQSHGMAIWAGHQ